MSVSPSGPVAPEAPSPSLWQMSQEELLALAVVRLQLACTNYKLALEASDAGTRDAMQFAAELRKAEADEILAIYRERLHLD